MKTITSNKPVRGLIQQIIVLILFIGTQPGKADGPMLMRLDASGNSMQSETTVYFSNGGTLYYDSLSDSRSLGTNPGYLNIVTVFNGVDCAIKGMPPLNQNMSIPVKITTGMAGIYQIQGSGIQDLPAGACLTLHDNLTNADFNLRSGPYTCSISDTESVTRFILNVNITTISLNSSFMDPTCSRSADGLAIASGPANTAWNYYWKDSSNNILKVTASSTDADTLAGLNAGWYKVDITAAGTCLSGSVNYYLQAVQAPNAFFSVSDTASDLVTTIEFTNNSVNADSFWWDFGDGEGTSDANTQHQYASPGVFTAKLTAINSNCGDSAVAIRNITVANEGTTGIKQNTAGNLNISRDAGGYYVYFPGDAARCATISVYNFSGEKVTNDLYVTGAVNEKINVALPGNAASGLLFISVTSNKGEYAYKKIINH